MAKIQNITSREILDCNGNPTIEATVFLDDGAKGTSSAPGGIAPTNNEAAILRDHDEKRFKGLGVLTAIQNVEKTIKPKLLSLQTVDQRIVDNALCSLDPTPNKAQIGSNTTIAVSMAYARAQATSNKEELFDYLKKYMTIQGVVPKIPTPAFNFINGGRYANDNLDFQEFLVIPASIKPFHESLHLGFIITNNIKDILIRENLSILLGQDGGFGPAVATNEDALVVLSQAIEAANLRLGYDVFCGIDVSGNDIYVNQQYKIKDRSGTLVANDLISYYEEIMKKYHILYIEDPLYEEDWEGYQIINQRLKDQAIIASDDLSATNIGRLQMAVSKQAISGVLVKPNQVGTILETLAFVEVARHAGLRIILSDRSGETNDDFIADLAVAVNADYVKFGSLTRGERVAKYNRLLAIESILQERMQH